FVTVAEELNVSRAAARLRISQPAVSRQLRDLEEELGVDLIDRRNSKLKLTAAGEVFLAHARDLLRRSNDAAKEMLAFREKGRQPLTVGYIAQMMATFTPTWRKFGQRRREIELVLRELAPAEQVQALRDDRIDLALPGYACAELANEFEVVVLGQIPFQAV